jgi:hypothetical protein
MQKNGQWCRVLWLPKSSSFGLTGELVVTLRRTVSDFSYKKLKKSLNKKLPVIVHCSFLTTDLHGISGGDAMVVAGIFQCQTADV